MIFTFQAELTGGAYMPESRVSRTIRIGGSATLNDLCFTLLKSIGFDHAHLYSFHMDGVPYGYGGYYGMPSHPGDRSAKEKLFRLNLKAGDSFLLIYDFGDDWQFRFTVWKVEDASGNIPAAVVEAVGTVEQYPDWEDDDEEEMDMDSDDSDGSMSSGSPGSDADRINSSLFEISGVTSGDFENFEEDDLSEEYFDDDVTEESNPRLGRLILRAVESQLNSGTPSFVTDAYRQLQEKGYIKKLAKVKLATALVNEIFFMQKNECKYSDSSYRKEINAVVAEPFDRDSIIDIETGRERILAQRLSEFDRLVFEKEDEPESAAVLFLKLWPLLKEYIEDNYTRESRNGLERFSPTQIDESVDYRLGLCNALSEFDMIFLNAGRYEDLIRLSREVLDTFSWGEEDRLTESNLKGCIGESLERLGRSKEADQWFLDWQKDSPHSVSCINYYSMILLERKCYPEALALLEPFLDTKKNADITERMILYSRAEETYSGLGDTEKASFYRKLMKKKPEKRLLSDPFRQKPVTVPSKIYPNDPCPCGSGKKYKKCCGK